MTTVQVFKRSLGHRVRFCLRSKTNTTERKLKIPSLAHHLLSLLPGLLHVASGFLSDLPSVCSPAPCRKVSPESHTHQTIHMQDIFWRMESMAISSLELSKTRSCPLHVTKMRNAFCPGSDWGRSATRFSRKDASEFPPVCTTIMRTLKLSQHWEEGRKREGEKAEKV